MISPTTLFNTSSLFFQTSGLSLSLSLSLVYISVPIPLFWKRQNPTQLFHFSSSSFFLDFFRPRIKRRKEAEMGMSIVFIYFLWSSMLLLSHLNPIATADALPPILSPILGGACDSIKCGKGTCKAAPNRTIPFVCECDAGWNQFHVEDNFRFMPCVIPNCTVNYSCSNASKSATAPPLPQANVSSLADPCTWAYCGEGTCMKTSGFGHKCECADGHANLLNITSLPCFTECALGGDCLNLGFGFANRSSSTSPGSSSSGAALSNACLNFSRNFLWSTSLVIFSVFQHA